MGDRAERSRNKLISFLQNHNPALRFGLAQILGEHETAFELADRQKQRFHPLTSLIEESKGSDGSNRSTGASGLATFSSDETAKFKDGFGRSLVPTLQKRSPAQFEVGQNVHHTETGIVTIRTVYPDNTYDDSDGHTRTKQEMFRAYWTGGSLKSAGNGEAKFYEGQEVIAKMNKSDYTERPGIIAKLNLDEGTYNVEFRKDRRVIEFEYGVSEESISLPIFDTQFEINQDVEIDADEVAKIIQEDYTREVETKAVDVSDQTGFQVVERLLKEQSDLKKEEESKKEAKETTVQQKQWIRGTIVARHSDLSYDVRLDRKGREMVLTYIAQKAVRKAVFREAGGAAVEDNASSKTSAIFQPGNRVAVWAHWYVWPPLRKTIRLVRVANPAYLCTQVVGPFVVPARRGYQAARGSPE